MHLIFYLQVQKLSARFNIAHSFCQTVPSVVAMMFYGVLSDKIGRRSIMIISAAGAFIDGLLVLLTMVLELPVYVLYIGGFFNGLAGSFTGAFMIAFAYIADITEKEKLPGRLGKTEQRLVCNKYFFVEVSYFENLNKLSDIKGVHKNRKKTGIFKKLLFAP